MPLSPEERAAEVNTLWYIEFRSIAAWDIHTPLMHIPVQRTNVRGETESDAKAEVLSWAGEAHRIDFLTVERAPEWLQ